MKLWLTFTNPDAKRGDEVVQGFVEMEFIKEEFLTLSEQELFQRFFFPAIAQLRNMIEDGEARANASEARAHALDAPTS